LTLSAARLIFEEGFFAWMEEREGTESHMKGGQLSRLGIGPGTVLQKALQGETSGMFNYLFL